MSYLLDKKNRKNKYIKYTVLIVFLFFLIYFRNPVFNGFSSVTHFIFRPVLILGNYFGEKLSNTKAYFSTKKSLFFENENLKSKINEQEARMANYYSVLGENLEIKKILGRSLEEKKIILSSILSKPNSSPYDTLIIDVGIQDEVKVGQRVFALGNIPIGKVAEVYEKSAKIILFSNREEKTEVVVGDSGVFMQVIGRGGGNFEMILPRDFVLTNGTEVTLPGINTYVLGTVETIISDPRDSFQKALLVSPVNIQELKFVEVEI